MTNKKEVLDTPTKVIPHYSSAWENYPEKEIKVCEISEPLCNRYLKVRNFYVARPYNFMMGEYHWANVTNTIELLMAVRFGLEWDMNKLADSLISDMGFHTQMYVKFQQYVMKHAYKEVAVIIAEFERTAFQVRFKSAFAITDLVGLKGKIDGLNITKAATDIYAIQQNNGPLSINREMFKRVFSQDYSPKMLDILRVQGIYKNDPKNVLLKTYGW